jgi:hypothetical protein
VHWYITNVPHRCAPGLCLRRIQAGCSVWVRTPAVGCSLLPLSSPPRSSHPHLIGTWSHTCSHKLLVTFCRVTTLLCGPREAANHPRLPWRRRVAVRVGVAIQTCLNHPDPRHHSHGPLISKSYCAPDPGVAARCNHPLHSPAGVTSPSHEACSCGEPRACLPLKLGPFCMEPCTHLYYPWSHG